MRSFVSATGCVVRAIPMESWNGLFRTVEYEVKEPNGDHRMFPSMQSALWYAEDAHSTGELSVEALEYLHNGSNPFVD